MGLSYGAFASELRFDGSAAASIVQHATNASLELDLSDRWTLQLAAGAVLGGHLSLAGTHYLIDPGATATLAASFRVFGGEHGTPFLLLSGSLSGSFTHTRDYSADLPHAPLTAGDVRLGATVGKTFLRVLSPYVAARVFGGPILWQLPDGQHTGTDEHHFQVGAGLVWAPLPRFHAFAELVPLGERRLSAGLGYAF